ncbi:hypothetical protein [Aureivirga sp. CE67]|uniref:hypothetical protein n=1 Tax=Aureivirga sp. CE67 TaxID=1788983 RepID=UPI0018CACC94|nr:hypothetical protein [Aureivirga sp. CE67]
MLFPEDYIDFLKWFKEQTEFYWSQLEENEWILNAKWQPLSVSEILEIEKKYKIQFSYEHKEFLKILHCIDKMEPRMLYNEEKGEYLADRPFFYNWQKDEKEIREMLNSPYNNIDVGIQYGGWVKSWGEKPSTIDEIESVLKEKYKSSPQLLPIFGHRFVVSLPNENYSPVLSIYTDVIYYGENIKHYLLHEIGYYIKKLFDYGYDEEDHCFYGNPKPELLAYKLSMIEKCKKLNIPFWSDWIH